MFKVSTKKSAIESSGGSSYIASSGIYDVTINFASIAVTAGGAESINFNVDYNGNAQTIYGPYITSKKGEPLEIGLKLINQLAIIAGLRDGDAPTVEDETHNVGKDNKPQDFKVIAEFSGVPVKIRLQEEYAINPNTNEIRKSMVPKAIFSAEGASAAEIIAQENGDAVTIGADLAKQEKYATNVTYRDNLTADDITAWKDSKSNASASKPVAKVANRQAGSLFK